MMTGGGGGGTAPDIGNAAPGASKNRCDHSAITRPTNVARLAIDGLCLLLTILLLWMWIRARRLLPSVKQILPWYTFGTLLVLTILYLMLGIILTTLGGCFIITPSSIAGVSVPASVASGIANLVLLGIIVLSLNRRLLQLSGHQTKIVTIVNLACVVLSAIAFVPSIVLSNMASIYRFTSGLDQASRALVATLSIDFSIAFYTSYFVAALVGSCTLVYAASRPNPSTMVSSKRRNIWLGCTIAFLLIGSGSAVVQMFAYSLPSRRLPEAAWITFLTIFNIFFILTIFTVLEIAQEIAVPMVDPKDIATYNPEASEETQPAMHKRFTYVRGSEIQLPQHTYASQNQAWIPISPTSPRSPRWPFTSPTRANFGFAHEPTSPTQHAF